MRGIEAGTRGAVVSGRPELEAFCRDAHPKIVGLLTLFSGDADLGSELAQETMIRVIQNWRKVHAMASPMAWTRRVALNLANSWFRRRLAQRRAERRLGSLHEVDAPADAADAVGVRRAIAQLPPRQRAAIVLRFFADLPTDEIASIMRCRPGTIWALTNQGLVSLRRLGLTDVEDGDG